MWLQRMLERVAGSQEMTAYSWGAQSSGHTVALLRGEVDTQSEVNIFLLPSTLALSF